MFKLNFYNYLKILLINWLTSFIFHFKLIERKSIYIRTLLICFIFLPNFTFATENNSNTVFNNYSIDTLQIQKHLEYLASDLFEGRAPGSLGSYLSAKYLGFYFDKYNLNPIGEDDTYYQNIAMHTTNITNQSVSLIQNDKEISLFKEKDFKIFKFDKKNYIPQNADLVFCGYGIVAPEFDYDDYYNLNVKNKIVVIFDDEPYSISNDYFDGLKKSKYSNLESKHRIAMSKGALGIVVIDNFCAFDELNWNRINKDYSFNFINNSNKVNDNLGLYINFDVAEKIFKFENKSINDLCDDHINGKIQSFELNTKIKINCNISSKDFISQNIIGEIRGGNSAENEEYIIISAHYDHLGIGKSINGDSIYNGTTDNALGVAVLLEIAKYFSINKTNKKSLIFLLTTGEEFGLLGSQYYTQYPLRPLKSTIANVNLDGIAFFDEFREVVVLGNDYTNISEITTKVLDKNKVKLGEIPNNFQKEEAFGLSDHYSFAKIGIPSFLIIEGINYKNKSYNEGLNFLENYSSNIYHTPFDDDKIKINYKSVIQHSEIIIDFLTEISNTDDKIEFISGSPFRNSYLILKNSK